MAHVESGKMNSAPQSLAVQSRDLRHEVGQLVNLFARQFNATMTSGHSDDSAQNSVQTEFLLVLRRLLKRTGSLSLEIEPFALLWQEELVFEDGDPEGIPSRLYQGGIRKLDLFLGIGDWEISQFFNILRASHERRQGPPDLVACLFEGDFLHLKCVGADDYFEAHPLVIPENLAELGHQYPRRIMPPALQSKIFREYCPGSEIDFLEGLKKDHRVRANGSRILDRLYLVTPEEAEKINSQILRESDQAFTVQTLETLIEVLLMEKTKEDFNQTASLILGILDRSIQTGDYHGAAAVLKSLYPCLRLASLKEWQKRGISKVIFEAGTESRIRAIHESITSSKGQDLEGLARYVCLLQRNAVPYLCRLLGELKASKPRRVICDALAYMGRKSIGVFGAFLDDERWYVVRNVVYILGGIGERECTPYLEKALDHPDSRVRREAVQAIVKAAPRETAIEHLTKKLHDVDGSIRGTAALHLARIGREEAVGCLLEVIQSKALQKREIREIRQFLQAIGITGSDEAVPALFRMLVKKNVFGTTRSDEIRKSVADALGVIGTDEAVMALRKASEMDDEGVKEASLAVLTRIGK